MKRNLYRCTRQNWHEHNITKRSAGLFGELESPAWRFYLDVLLLLLQMLDVLWHELLDDLEHVYWQLSLGPKNVQRDANGAVKITPSLQALRTDLLLHVG